MRGGRALAGVLCATILMAACTGTTVSAPTGEPTTYPTGAPATPSAPTREPELHDYDFGKVELDGGNKKANFPIRGIVAVPAASSAAPVAVVLHLAGLPCTDRTEQLPCKDGLDARFDKGMTWLATALAAHGYVVIAPDLTKTRDFRYETVTVPLGWKLANESLKRLRADPAAFGIPSDVDVSGTTVLVGHSVGGDNAMWWAVERPADIAAVVLLQPAPLQPGLFPPPASPYAYPNEAPKTHQIPLGLPFAVLMGRCDDDAGYSGGLYIVNATVDPERTATTVTAILPTADHLMFNTRALRTTSPPQAGCPDPSSTAHRAESEATRAAIGAWTANVLTVFLDPALGSGALARAAGIDISSPGTIEGMPDASVIVAPAATKRTTVLLPMGGALGVDGPGGRDVDGPSAGAETGVTYDVVGLTSMLCTSGGVVPIHSKGREPCTSENAERPGFGPALHLRPTSSEGTWTATLPTPVAGDLLLTISADPTDPPARVQVSAGGATTEVDGSALAVPTAGRMASDRTIPRQIRIPLAAPVSSISVTVDGGAVFLQDVMIAPN